MPWFTLYLALASLGIDVGWQPLPGGGYEYIIHLEPQALTALGDGLEIHSQVPPFLRDFRSCRVVVSEQEPPRLGEPEPAATSAARPDTTSAAAPAALGEAQKTAQPIHPEVQQTAGEVAFPAPSGTTQAAPPAVTPKEPALTPVNPFPAPPPEVADPRKLDNPLADPFGKPASAEPAAKSPTDATAAKEPAPSKPHPPEAAAASSWIDPARAPDWLLGTAIGLFVSLGGNAYLGYLAWGFRGRYERAIERLKQNLKA